MLFYWKVCAALIVIYCSQNTVYSILPSVVIVCKLHLLVIYYWILGLHENIWVSLVFNRLAENWNNVFFLIYNQVSPNFLQNTVTILSTNCIT